MVSRGGGGECVASCGELVSDRSSHFGDSVLKMSPQLRFENVSIKIRLFIPMYKSIMSVLGH